LATVTTGQYIATFIRIAGAMLWISIFVRACLSWFAMDARGSGVVRLLDDICEPIMAPLRRVVPPIGSIDISPLIAIIVIQAVASLIANQIH
jgi:YggT family protein